jgi:hypothetical protein
METVAIIVGVVDREPQLLQARVDHEDSEHVAWRVVPVDGRAELEQAIKESVPRKTHVLVDPEYGDEEASLQPIIRE